MKLSDLIEELEAVDSLIIDDVELKRMILALSVQTERNSNSGSIVSYLTDRDKAMLSWGYCVGKEVGHNETVEGYFGSSGRSECHMEDAAEFIRDLTSDDIEHSINTYKQSL